MDNMIFTSEVCGVVLIAPFDKISRPPCSTIRFIVFLSLFFRCFSPFSFYHRTFSLTTHISTEKMKVLVVRPMEMPEVQEIDHTLSAMQELVGGTIQAVYPFDDPVALVCNDEGKLLGLPWNRALTDDHGVPYDIVCGTFFVAGLKEDDFASLTEQQIEKYKDKYSHEMILSVPKQPQAQKKPMKKEKHEYER